MRARRGPARIRPARVAAVAAAIAVALLMTGCGAGPAPATTSAGRTPESAASSTPARAYSSTSFLRPFDVVLPAWAAVAPSTQDPRFVTWEAADGVRKLRVMDPVALYPPGSTTSTAIPADYDAYLTSLEKHGVHLTAPSTPTVDSVAAHVYTVDADAGLDGALGCPATTTAAGDCFGPQPELTLRLAVMRVRGDVLLVWMRDDAGSNTHASDLADFDAMLASMRFSTRAPSA